jgi:hypothetical protein
MNRRIMVPALALGLLAVVGGSWFGIRSHGHPELEVVAVWWAPKPLQYGMRSVEGRIRNNAVDAFQAVSIDVDLLDARGDSLYTRTVAVGELHAREEKLFTTWLLPGQPKQFRVRSVTGMSRSTLPRK